MFRKDSKVKEEDLVLIETQKLEEKCGECGKQLILKVYWSKKGHQRKIECSNCNIEMWHTPVEQY
jgi:hypothetical protein